MGVLLTLIVIIGHYVLPQKRVVVYPSASNEPRLYGFPRANIGRSSYWINQQNNEWGCKYEIFHSYGCGWELYESPKETEGIDLTAFDAIEVSMAYEGSASRIRVYLRNFNEAYADVNDVGSTKFMSVSFPVAEASGPVLIELSEFSVASWWLREKNIRRQWSLPDFNHITNIGIDFIENGTHKARVDSVALVGEWIKTEILVFIVLVFWMTVFLLQGTLRFYQLYKKAQRDRYLIKSLEHKQQSLEDENRTLELIVDTDPLTGVLNRAGLQSSVNALFGGASAAEDIGVLLIDIDHFKRINDTYGHDMGDRALKAFATMISINLREEDVFARWGGEEFIVICRNRSTSSLLNFAEKLREIAANYTLGVDFDVNITISIGLAVARQGELFDEVFKRADKALYRAKQSGRNRIEYEQQS